jgi:hypothetical protein
MFRATLHPFGKVSDVTLPFKNVYERFYIIQNTDFISSTPASQAKFYHSVSFQ